MDTQQTLYGLMRLAREQQDAVTQALAALAGERDALREERQAWARAVDTLKVADALSTAVEAAKYQLDTTTTRLGEERASLVNSREALAKLQADILKAVQTHARKGADDAMTDVLGNWESRGAQALEKGLTPFMSCAATLTEETNKAAQRLTQAGKWFTWKWALLAFALMAGLVVSSTAVLYWQGQKLDAMERNMALLKAKGADLTLSTCGDKREVCVAIDEGKGTYTPTKGKKNTYAIVESK